MIFNCKIFVFSEKYFNIQFYYHNNNKTYRSLLEALETYRVPLINYQCRSGYCGTCRALLIKGQVQYHKEPLSYISSNEILTCCCAPVEHIILKLL